MFPFSCVAGQDAVEPDADICSIPLESRYLHNIVTVQDRHPEDRMQAFFRHAQSYMWYR